jgi:hypothetical protein
MGNLLQNPMYMHVLDAINAKLLEEQEEIAQNARRSNRNRPNRHRNRGYALEEVATLSDEVFCSMFRMTRAGFDGLLTLISLYMHDTNVAMARVSSNSHISKETKLYATLRWLAGGSYLDICFAWGISKASFFSTSLESGVVWPTMEAIDIAFDISLPGDNETLQQMSDEFAIYSRGELRGCVTAIDGWVARTRKPFHTEVTDVMAYRNRHDCWGVVVLAGCDARCRFTMFSCMNSGSTNDTIAWELSQVKTALEQNLLPCAFFLIGDEAFPCSNQLLVPYGGNRVGPWKDSFNFHLSVMR